MQIFKTITYKTLIVFLLIVALICFLGGYFVKKTSLESKKFTVVIDAGHGGIDAGALGVTTSVRESDLNLLIAKNLKELFEKSGFIAIMTREGDNGLYGTTDPGFKKRDLKEREKIINNSLADLCVSIHLNVYSSQSRRGAQVFFNKDYLEDKKLATLVQGRINGLNLSPRLYDALHGDYYLLNTSKIPTIIVECGFLSSPEDEKLLLTDKYRHDISNAIFMGCVDYLSV